MVVAHGLIQQAAITHKMAAMMAEGPVNIIH